MNKDQDLLLCELQNDKDILLSRLRMISLHLDDVLLLMNKNESTQFLSIKQTLIEIKRIAEKDIPLWGITEGLSGTIQS